MGAMVSLNVSMSRVPRTLDMDSEEAMEIDDCMRKISLSPKCVLGHLKRVF